MRYFFILVSFILLSSNLLAQEEFLIGKSANTLRSGGAAISGEYNASVLGNIFVRRYGFDLAYGASDRLTLSVRGSFSDLENGAFDLETGSLIAIYQVGNLDKLPKKWAIAPFLQSTIVGRNATVPADINLDTYNSGFAGGIIATRNMDDWTLSGSLAYAKLINPRVVDGLLEGKAILYQFSAIKTIGISADRESLTLGFLGELMGQYNSDIQKDNLFLFASGRYLDLLAGLQFTALNQYRLEIAIQDQVFGNLQRFSDGLFHLRLKYLMF